MYQKKGWYKDMSATIESNTKFNENMTCAEITQLIDRYGIDRLATPCDKGESCLWVVVKNNPILNDLNFLRATMRDKHTEMILWNGNLSFDERKQVLIDRQCN